MICTTDGVRARTTSTVVRTESASGVAVAAGGAGEGVGGTTVAVAVATTVGVDVSAEVESLPPHAATTTAMTGTRNMSRYERVDEFKELPSTLWSESGS